jgi:hypothetical protein
MHQNELCDRHFLGQRGDISLGVICSAKKTSRNLEQKGCEDTEPDPMPTRTMSPFPIFEITSLSTGFQVFNNH